MKQDLDSSLCLNANDLPELIILPRPSTDDTSNNKKKNNTILILKVTSQLTGGGGFGMLC